MLRAGRDQRLLGADALLGLGPHGLDELVILGLGRIGALPSRLSLRVLRLLGGGDELLAAALHVLDLLAHLLAEAARARSCAWLRAASAASARATRACHASSGRASKRSPMLAAPGRAAARPRPSSEPRPRRGPRRGGRRARPRRCSRPASRRPRAPAVALARRRDRAAQQFDLRRPRGQRRVELGQRRLELGVVVTEASASVRATSISACATSIAPARSRGRSCAGRRARDASVALRAELLLERRHALARAGGLGPRRGDRVVHRRRWPTSRSASRSSSACCSTVTCACACASCSSNDGDLPAAGVRACLCDLGRGAHPFELGGAVGQLRFECRLRARGRVGGGPDLRLERAGVGGRARARGASAWSRSASASSRSASAAVALGARLVALGPQMAEVRLGR